MNIFAQKTFTLSAVIWFALTLAIIPANAQNSGLYSDASVVLVQEGDQALAAEDYSAALVKFEQGVVADPQNIDAYVGLGRLYFEVKSYILSLKYFDIALTMDPTNLGILELSAYSHMATDSQEALDEIRQKMETICIAGSCEELERLNEALSTDEVSVPAESDNS